METRRHIAPAARFVTGSCPFCGRTPSSAIVDELCFFDGLQERTSHQVACRCGAKGPVRSSPAEAAAAWNAAVRLRQTERVVRWLPAKAAELARSG